LGGHSGIADCRRGQHPARRRAPRLHRSTGRDRGHRRLAVIPLLLFMESVSLPWLPARARELTLAGQELYGATGTGERKDEMSGAALRMARLFDKESGRT